MAEEAKLFDFGDVVAAICDKLVRRHPHVFGDERGASPSADDQTRRWEEIKREERDAERRNARARGRAGGAPRSQRVRRSSASARRRSGSTGPTTAGVRAKVTEELAEVDAALAARTATSSADAAAREAVAAEVGDLLFTIANLCRHLDLDPEACVRGANARFEKRFDHVEARVSAAGGDGAHMIQTPLERLWEEAKNATR